MQHPDALTGSHVPFARRWHVINEIDLIPLIADHADTERLCARLKTCADQLPERAATDEIDDVCNALQTRVIDHIEREDQLLATMFARDLPDPLCHALLERVHDRHVACTMLAQDLIATLRADAAGRRTLCSDALGYMLRCFFEGARAAMAFEELAILTLADRRLTSEARALLAQRLGST